MKNLVYKNGKDEKPSTRNTRQRTKAREHVTKEHNNKDTTQKLNKIKDCELKKGIVCNKLVRNNV